MITDSTIIILVHAFAESGKDVLGEYLVENYGYKRAAFADIMKNECSKIYNIPRHLMDTHSGKNSIWRDNVTVRDKIIEYAESVRFKEGQNCWAKRLVKYIKESEEVFEKIVITDMRYPVEYETIANDILLPTYCVKIERFEKSKIDSITERGFENNRFHWFFVIDNKDDWNEYPDARKRFEKQIDKLMSFVF